MNFPDVLRAPDAVRVSTDTKKLATHPAADGSWQSEGGEVRVATALTWDTAGQARLHIKLQSGVPVRSVQLRWRGEFAPATRFLGDAWERGYGDLEWRGLVSERVMPWYFLAFDGRCTAGFGVETGPNALCHWKTDGGGVILHLDVKSGGVGVQLGERTLDVATVRFVEGEAPFATAHNLCRALCPQPLLPRHPVYGGNDWYYAYGNNSRASIMRDTQTINELSPDGSNRPFMVIDDGWQECHHPWNGGPWNRASPQFGDMKSMANSMKECGVRPGLWFRPLLSALNVPTSWRFRARSILPPDGMPLDPSMPEVLALVADDVRRFKEWGFELVKHDFSTYDIFWRWGFEFGDAPCSPSDTDVTVTEWRFAHSNRTSAEIIKTLYQTMRDAAGDDMLLLGCNTIGHLGAGVFEIQRTGDDTSGREWERTRKMGINTLAFRMAQHDTFFAVDADCVGLTNEIPWELNRQWLDVLARSGTPLFVSADPEALGREQKAALREAFALASQSQSIAEPLDWLDTTCPSTWKCGDDTHCYQWFDT